MKLAVIGSRNLTKIRLEEHFPVGVSEIVSGGARGVDLLAREFARKNHIPLVEFLPQYALYGRAAPLKRNEEIAAYADEAIAFWDGSSKGCAYTVKAFQRLGKRVTVVLCDAENLSEI